MTTPRRSAAGCGSAIRSGPTASWAAASCPTFACRRPWPGSAAETSSTVSSPGSTGSGSSSRTLRSPGSSPATESTSRAPHGRCPLSTTLAWSSYALVPTAPPWWASEEGYTDAKVRRIMVEVGEEEWGRAWPALYDTLGGNPWAAMPSLHFATSLMAALLLAEMGPRAGAIGGAYAGAAWLRPGLPGGALCGRSARRRRARAGRAPGRALRRAGGQGDESGVAASGAHRERLALFANIWGVREERHAERFGSRRDRPRDHRGG